MKLTNEIKIGIMVVSVLGVLAVLTLKTGKVHLSDDGYPVKVHFKDVDGVTLNSPVMLNGLEVGLVKNISVVETGSEVFMELTLSIKHGIKIHEGAKANVKMMGFMGEKYVGLTSGDAGKAVLSENSVIMGNEPADLDKLLKDGQEIANQLKLVSTNINERLQVNKDHIDNIFLNFDTSMKHIASISENLDERLTVNKGNIDETLSNLKHTTVNLDQFSYDLKLNPWKLLYRTKEQREESLKELKK